MFFSGDAIPVSDDVTGSGIILHHFDRIAFGRFHLFRYEAGGHNGRKKGKNCEILKNGSSHVTVKINENENGNANGNEKDGEKSTENGSNFSSLVSPPGWEYAQEELMMKNNSQILSFQSSKIGDGHRYLRNNNNNENEIILKNDIKQYSNTNNSKGKNIPATVTENEKRFISVNGDSVLLETVSVSSPDRNRPWTGTKSPPKISDSPGIHFDRNKNTSLMTERGSDMRNRHNLLQFESLNKLKNKNRDIINMTNIPNRIKANSQSSDWNQKISFEDGNGRNSVYSGTNSLNLSVSKNGSHAPLGTSTSTSTPRIMLVRPKISQSLSKDKDEDNMNDEDDVIDDINDEKRENKDRKNNNLDDVYTDLENSTNDDITERKKAVKNMVDNHIGDYMPNIQRDSRRDWEIIERSNGGRVRTATDTVTGRNGVFHAKDKNIVDNGSDSRGVNSSSRILMTSNKTLNLNEKFPGELDQSRNARINLQHNSSSMKIEGGNIDSGGNGDVYNELNNGDANIDTDNTINIEKNKKENVTGFAANYNTQKNSGNDNDTDNDSNNDDKSDDNDTDNNPDNKNHNNGNKFFVSNYDNNNIKKHSPKNNNNNSNINNYDNNGNINAYKNLDIITKTNVKIKNKDDSIDKVQVPTFEKEALALQLELAQMQKALQDRMHRYQVLTSFNPEKSVN
jgi:hypothetical protein